MYVMKQPDRQMSVPFSMSLSLYIYLLYFAGMNDEIKSLF